MVWHKRKVSPTRATAGPVAGRRGRQHVDHPVAGYSPTGSSHYQAFRPAVQTSRAVQEADALEEMAPSMRHDGTRSRRARAASQPGSQHVHLATWRGRVEAVLHQVIDQMQSELGVDRIFARL